MTHNVQTGIKSTRIHKNALGPSVQKMKSKVAMKIRQKISKYSDTANEGGEKETDELEDELELGYTAESFPGGCISLVIYLLLLLFFV